jgi:Tfp pilus assembly protein PilF
VRLVALASAALVVLGCGSKRSGAGDTFPEQSVWVAPPRPRLPETADTNDASTYFLHGSLTISHAPDTAAAAFFWATQLDPWRANAYYARSVALLRTMWERHPVAGIWLPRRSPREHELKIVDSLNRVAYSIDPYIDRHFDRLIGPPPSLVRCDRVRDATSAGLCFMQLANYAQSAQKLAAALKKAPKEIFLHYVRAQALFQLRHFDSAAIALGVLADSLGKRQEKELNAFYVSRATIYYAQGMAYTQLNDTAGARVAYERALVEDLSFHMANVRLAGRALATGDTVAALAHLEQAVGLSPNDVPLRYYYGASLMHANRPREAEEHFRRAIELNAYYAPPHLLLAMLLEKRDVAAAARSYDAYLARAARRDSTREWAARRLRSLVDAFESTDAESLAVTPKKQRTDSPATKPDDPKVPPEPLDDVQQASEESFPASDAPAWEPLHPGKPSDHPDRKPR